jgi:hypothetical protein
MWNFTRGYGKCKSHKKPASYRNLHISWLLLSRSTCQAGIARGDSLAYKFFASVYTADHEFAAFFVFFSSFAYSYTLKIVSICSSEASVHFRRTKRLPCNIPRTCLYAYILVRSIDEMRSRWGATCKWEDCPQSSVIIIDTLSLNILKLFIPSIEWIEWINVFHTVLTINRGFFVKKHYWLVVVEDKFFPLLELLKHSTIKE